MTLPPVGVPPPGDPGSPGPEGSCWPDGLPEPGEPTDAELLGLWPDPFAGPPDGADAWLGDLSLPELDALAGEWAAGQGAAEAAGAGFTRDLPGDPALG